MKNLIHLYKDASIEWENPFDIEDEAHLVLVSFIRLLNEDSQINEWRVAVWDQTMGFEKDFIDEKLAWNSFQSIIEKEFVSPIDLNQDGFFKINFKKIFSDHKK
jgi:hypothetical protein